jgi:hypothetical protein
MPDTPLDAHPPRRRAKFDDPLWTEAGEPRARVALTRPTTLWFNTGSRCNIACAGCYIESAPDNDRLAYLAADDVRRFLDEAAGLGWPLAEIGFTGGEPFLNRALPAMLEDALGRGYRALVLTNAMRPMQREQNALAALRARFGRALTLRASIDHYRRDRHEAVRGPGTWEPAIAGVRWLAEGGFGLAVAARTLWDEDETSLRRGFAALFAAEHIGLDAFDPAALVLFPEMDPKRDAPEITERCWQVLGVSPDAMMCASSRMVIKRRGAAAPVVVPCTLLPYDPRFELGATLADAAGPVALNHRFCAQFCVLGGGSCAAR